MQQYPAAKTAVIVVDPYNDFLSPGGKLWPYTQETVQGTGLVNNLQQLLTAARMHNILMVYTPHHQTKQKEKHCAAHEVTCCKSSTQRLPHSIHKRN